MAEQKAPDRRVVKTKKAIKKSFVKLLSQKDINDITVSDIANLADINRKTFYNYYDGVYAVVDEIEDEFVRSVDEVLTEFDFTKNMRKPYMVFEKLTTVINNDIDVIGYLLSGESNLGLTNKLVGLLKVRTKEVLSKYFDIEEKRLDLMLEFMMPGMVAVYQRWFNSDRREPLEHISAEINLLVFKGLSGYLDIDIGSR